MSRGARNWPFLTLTTRPVARRRREQVGLARQERRDLQHVGDLGDRPRPATARGCRSGSGRRRPRAPARACARLPPSPGPRNDVADVRFALSYDALKMYGTPARRAMSRSASASLDRVRFALDDARPGDQHQRSRRRRVTPPTATLWTGAHSFSPTTAAGRRMPRRELVLVARVDEAGEERMRLERLRLELRVELHRDVPRMRRQLDDLDELAVERAADDLQALVGQRLLVEAVELVAMAVALVDHLGAIELRAPASRASAGTRSEPSRIVPPRSSTPSRSRSL